MHEAPRDVATELYEVVESVLVDEVRPAIEYLGAASRVTAEELRERFEDERKGTMTTDPMPSLRAGG